MNAASGRRVVAGSAPVLHGAGAADEPKYKVEIKIIAAL